MRSSFAVALTGLLVLVTGPVWAQDKTEISLSRFFGACEADYADVTDVAKAHGECGIITALINKFNAESPDVHVKVDIVEWPGYDQLTARLRSDDPPTISVMHESVISDYASRGLLEPLDEDFKAAGIDLADFTDAARTGVTKDGKIYALPFDTHTWLWHINLNLFKQAGLVGADGKPVLPKSPEELLAQAKQFKEKTGKPYFVQATVNEQANYARTLYTLLYQQNSDFFADPTQIKLQTPEARNAVELFKTIYQGGDTTKDQDYAAATAGFAQGDGGVYIMGTWLIDSYNEEAAKPGGALSNGYTVVPFPQLYGNPKVWADGHSWVVPKAGLDDAKRKAAVKVLKFLWDNDFEWARTGHLPVRQSVAASQAFLDLPHRKDIVSLTKDGTALPQAVKRQFGLQEILTEEFNAAAQDQKTVDQALADAESRVNELLANAK
ncbi:extracellular solute-binding protein [Inquilinus sp.]|jgi:multiple sugar transport system substrate-binding protein|uniref:extracellular solute-binding protein n=1 Tax=Inquilinus sp. TaxID=1932117 RepID=UPI003783BBCA